MTRSVLITSILLAASCTSEDRLGNTQPHDTGVTPYVGAARWALSIGGPSGRDGADGIAIDPSTGDVLVAGQGAAGADLGSGPIASDSPYGFGFVTRRAALDGHEL